MLTERPSTADGAQQNLTNIGQPHCHHNIYRKEVEQIQNSSKRTVLGNCVSKSSLSSRPQPHK